MHLVLYHLETALIFCLFLLAIDIFQRVLLSFVPITRVFSHRKIREKRSSIVFTLKELNFADITVFGIFPDI